VDEAVLERHTARLAKCLDVLDKALTKMSYLGGDEYSLVDINYMPTMYVINKCVDVFGGRPNLQKWWSNVSSRDAWKKVIKPLDDAYGSVVPDWHK
jgi:glutathione S-transferase